MTPSPAVPERDRGLRIGICLSLYWPIESGAERQARRQARELVRRGHHVTVYTRRFKGRPIREWDGNVEVHRAIRTVSPGPLFGATFLTSLAWRLWRDRAGLDLLHCHQASWEAVAAGWIHRRTGLPTVIQPAAGGRYGEVRQMSRTRGRHVVRSLILANSRFVAISRQIEEELQAFGVPREHLLRFASGVDVAEFAPGESPPDSRLPPRPRAIFLGRLHPQKNLVVLLHAWQLVRNQCPAAHLLLIGDGPQRQELERLVDSLRLEQSVHFLGPRTDPLPYLQASDLFILPSVSEGMSNSLLEAMACGLPSVVSSVGGNVDLIRDGHTGFVADATAPTELAERIIEMLNNSALRRRCGLRARELVRAEYSIESVVDRYEILYRQLVARRASSS